MSHSRAFRHAVLGASALASLFTMGAPVARAETATYQFDIPARDLGSALAAYGVTANQAIVFSEDVAQGKKTKGLQGQYTANEALDKLLAGTGLVAKRTPAGTIMIAQGAVKAAEASRVQPTLRPVTTFAAAETVSGSAVEGLVVTAQKKREQIQDVPIAISAFSADALQAQKIEGGFDLLKAIPNVTFSKNNFTGYNFSIRGVGTKAISVTTDQGVAVAFNNVTLIRNRLFEQEYFDVERVEVLRGPQGTLYGRNATSGVINLISAKPELDGFSGSLKGEVGNYNAKRLIGIANVPLINDVLAVRLAGSMTSRDGYGLNLYNDKPVDGRDLWSARLSIGFEPIESFRANFIWERFHEDDDRARTSKQLCTRDPGPDEVGGIPLIPNGEGLAQTQRGFLSQGCLPGSLYDDAAYGTPNGNAIPFVLALQTFGVGFPRGSAGYDHCVLICTVILEDSDPYGNAVQSRDLREIYSQLDAVYRANADIFELNLEADLTPHLTAYSQTAYNQDEVYSSQDFNRFTTYPVFEDTSGLFASYSGDMPSYFRDLLRGGIFCDPQLGCSDTIVGKDLSRAKSEQFSQEFRIQSNFDGRLNFSAGIGYTRYSTVEDYYVFFNGITLAAIVGINGGPGATFSAGRDILSPDKFTLYPDCTNIALAPACVPIETNSVENIQDVGHNYFLSRNPYKLASKAAFGEMYFDAADNLKITAGLRYTDDEKTFTRIPSQTLLSGPEVTQAASQEVQDAVQRLHLLGLPLFGTGQGYPALPDITRQWREVTGRIGFDWKPNLSFTDETMIYAFYSRGYKGGGMNPPSPGLNYDEAVLAGIIYPPSAPVEFRPEFVNAYEAGAKNTLLQGGLVLNVTGFYYDYKDYQVSKIVDRSAQNENFDAQIWGLEFESVFAPSQNLRFNASLGFLDTKLEEGSKSIDILNRTAGNPDWILTKPVVTLMSNCIVPVSVAALLLGNDGREFVQNVCPGGGIFGWDYSGKPRGLGGLVQFLPDGSTWDPSEHPEINYGAGFDTDVSGHELPNSPHVTVSLGAQYSWDLFDGDWTATVRGDAYWQSQSWARIYQLPIDKLHGWYNTNLSFWLERPEDDLKFEFYIKNILDETPITDTFTNSDDTALTTNVFTLDPRLIGLSITKGF